MPFGHGTPCPYWAAHKNGGRNVAAVLRVCGFLTNFVVSLLAERICASGGAVLTKQKHISDMEENPNNMVEGVPAGTKKRSGSSILPLVIAVLVCAALAGAIMLMRGGCSNSSALKIGVEAANAKCPYDMGYGGSLLSIKYDEDRNEVAMLMAVNEEIASPVVLKKNNAIAKKQMRLNLSQSTSKRMLQDLVNAGASFKATFKGMTSGKTVDIVFSPGEIKEMLNSNMSQTEIDEMRFENWLIMQQEGCPQDLGDGMTITKVTSEGDDVVMYIHVEYAEELDNVRAVNDEAKLEMLSEIAGDKTGQSELQLLAINFKGLVYRFYHDDTEKCVDIAFTFVEMNEVLPGKRSGYLRGVK